MTFKKSVSTKSPANNFLWINIVYGVKTHDVMFILCFRLTIYQFYANDNRYKVLRY